LGIKLRLSGAHLGLCLPPESLEFGLGVPFGFFGPHLHFCFFLGHALAYVLKLLLLHLHFHLHALLLLLKLHLLLHRGLPILHLPAAGFGAQPFEFFLETLLLLLGLAGAVLAARGQLRAKMRDLLFDGRHMGVIGVCRRFLCEFHLQ